MNKIKLLKIKGLAYPLGSIVLLLIIWESIVKLGFVKSIFLPPPSAVFLSLLGNYEYLIISILITLKHIAIGYFIGVLLAVFLGILIGWYKNIDLSISPILLIISTIPIVTFFPLFILWFGLGITPIILCAVIAAFFPTLSATVSGVKKVNKDYIEVAKNFNMDEKRILIKVILPASLPYITNGLRLSIQLTFLITPVAEMLMGDVGLGGFIWKNADLFRTELVILGQITLGVMGLSLFKIFDLVEKNYILPWMRIKK